jgi:hypothetical protein
MKTACHNTEKYARPRVERAWQGENPRTYVRKQNSIVRTIEKLQGKLALAATWENVDKSKRDKSYIKELHHKIDMYRCQLRYKGALLTRHEEAALDES